MTAEAARRAPRQLRSFVRAVHPRQALALAVAVGTLVALTGRPGREIAVSAATVFVAIGPAFAQAPAPTAPQTSQSSQSQVFRSGSALVALNVSVQDGTAKYVTGLQPADFAVYEDGVKQDVRFFESSAVPVDLIVLIVG